MGQNIIPNNLQMLKTGGLSSMREIPLCLISPLNLSVQGACKMSFCIGLVFPNVIYIASDSRSSIPVYDKNSNKPISFQILNDNCEKIYIIDDCTVAFSTGQNAFGSQNKSFAEMMDTINFSSMTLEEVLKALNEKFSPLIEVEQGMDISVFSMKNGNPQLAELAVGIHGIVHNYVIFPPQLFYHAKGVEWAEQFIPGLKSTRPDELLIELYKTIYSNRENYDYTVGGPINILALTSSGYRWIKKLHDIDK